MNAEEIQAQFAEVLASETVYIPDDPEYIGENATDADLEEYEQYVREMTGVEPVRKSGPAQSEGMVALQDDLWNEWCSR